MSRREIMVQDVKGDFESGVQGGCCDEGGEVWGVRFADGADGRRKGE